MKPWQIRSRKHMLSDRSWRGEREVALGREGAVDRKSACMRSQRMRLGRFLYAACLTMIIGGCYTQVLIDQDSIATTNSNDIIVSVKDGRIVSFSSGSYTMATDTAGLQGSGRVQPRLSAQDEPFAGQIPLDDIDSIHSSEKATFYYLSVVAGVAATSFVIVVLITLGRYSGV